MLKSMTFYIKSTLLKLLALMVLCWLSFNVMNTLWELMLIKSSSVFFFGMEVYLQFLTFSRIVLILKVDSLNNMSHFCPISLYNTLYKLISNIIANRLTLVLCEIIIIFQSTFLPNWPIKYNKFLLVMSSFII